MQKYNKKCCKLYVVLMQNIVNRFLNTEITEAICHIHGSEVRISSMYSKLIYKLKESPVKVTEFLLL